MELTQNLSLGAILFCILEGVSYYEDAQRRDELIESVVDVGIFEISRLVLRDNEGSVD